MDALVSTEWLANELGANDLRVVDATYVLASDGRDPAAEYEAAHIPGAVFFDIAEISDLTNPLPTMLPPPEKFASRMQSLGLGDGSRIVLYDNSPYRTAARAWWMLRVFGAHDVAILDGGLAKWQAEGRPVFAYFTADWCLTCKVNEKSAIETQAVADAFAKHKVAVLVGDWTDGDPTLGRFIERHNRAGVPLYLWYAKGAQSPRVLPQILTKATLTGLSS